MLRPWTCACQGLIDYPYMPCEAHQVVLTDTALPTCKTAGSSGWCQPPCGIPASTSACSPPSASAQQHTKARRNRRMQNPQPTIMPAHIYSHTRHQLAQQQQPQPAQQHIHHQTCVVLTRKHQAHMSVQVQQQQQSSSSSPLGPSHSLPRQCCLYLLSFNYLPPLCQQPVGAL